MEVTTRKYIYGAGKYGKLLHQCLSSHLVKVDYFVQTDEPVAKEVEGIPLISIDTMLKIEGRKIIFIAIKNRKIAKEIKKRLSDADKCNINTYYCGGFIEENLLFIGKKRLSGKCHCIVCGSHFEKFLPTGAQESVYKRHHIIGGGYRSNCVCPCCGVGDRERWIYYVLKNKTDISKLSGRVLHFAPEDASIDYIRENENIDYYAGDIVSGIAMHTIDITDIHFRDNSFDYVISNHVLEHIIDEEKAILEVKRVLKQNGKWLFSFPICTDMKTYEDRTVISPKDRLEEYGQEEHVRLYGYDYIERFKKYGFELQTYSPLNEFNNTQIEKLGFIRDDVIILATNSEMC